MTDLSLFSEEHPAPEAQPLAARMRPRTLAEFVGQNGLVGDGTAFRRAIEQDRLASAIFWGPPGCGKTTVARIIAESSNAHFEPFSAVTSGVAEVRKAIAAARTRRPPPSGSGCSSTGSS